MCQFCDFLSPPNLWNSLLSLYRAILDSFFLLNLILWNDLIQNVYERLLLLLFRNSNQFSIANRYCIHFIPLQSVYYENFIYIIRVESTFWIESKRNGLSKIERKTRKKYNKKKYDTKIVIFGINLDEIFIIFSLLLLLLLLFLHVYFRSFTRSLCRNAFNRIQLIWSYTLNVQLHKTNNNRLFDWIYEK